MKKDKEIHYLHEYAFYSTEAIINFHKMPYLTKSEIIKQRISKRQLDQFRRVADLEYKILGQLIGITERGLHYKKDDDLFSCAMSDSIGGIIDLYGFGYVAFKDASIFNKWMKIGSPEKRYEPPLNHCETLFGKQETRREIFKLKGEYPSTYG